MREQSEESMKRIGVLILELSLYCFFPLSQLHIFLDFLYVFKRRFYCLLDCVGFVRPLDWIRPESLSLKQLLLNRTKHGLIFH